MIILILVNVLCILVAIWAIQQYGHDPSTRKHVFLLLVAGASFSVVFALLMLFDFLEAVQNNIFEHFTHDTSLQLFIMATAFFVLSYGFFGYYVHQLAKRSKILERK